MIKMKIDNKGLEKLVRDLKKLRFELLRETSETMISLSKTLNESYTHSIDDLVYDQYEPVSYERTRHLQGAHGARVEEMELAGERKKYSFYINEDSTDPVDGTSWKEKADNIEQGSSKMSVGFNRPFISETQERLEWETTRLSDALIRKYDQIISRVGG